MNVVLLQAAMGLGILIVSICKFLLFFGLLLLTLILNLNSVNKHKKENINKLSNKELFNIGLRSFLFATLIIIFVGILIFALLLTVNISDS